MSIALIAFFPTLFERKEGKKVCENILRDSPYDLEKKL